MKIYKTSPDGKPVEKKPKQTQLIEAKILTKKGATSNGQSTKIKTFNPRDWDGKNNDFNGD